jgi:hypothetical protein
VAAGGAPASDLRPARWLAHRSRKLQHQSRCSDGLSAGRADDRQLASSWSPSGTARAGTTLLRLPLETAASHFCGDHLAAVWQVGEGASLRRDASLSVWSGLGDCKPFHQIEALLPEVMPLVLQANARRRYQNPVSGHLFSTRILNFHAPYAY